MKTIYLALSVLLFPFSLGTPEKVEWVLSSTGLSNYGVLNNEEIVYVKSLGYKTRQKFRNIDYLAKEVLQICKKNLSTTQETILLDITWEEYYYTGTDLPHFKYQNPRFNGVYWIKGLDVCWRRGQIAFALMAGRPGPKNEDVPTGIYVMDFDGKNLRRLVPYFAYRPLWNKDGDKLVFSAIGEPGLKKFGGTDKGIFYYDLHKDTFHLITEHLPEERVWDEAQTGLYMTPHFKPFSRLDTYHVNLDGTGFELYESRRALRYKSPDGQYTTTRLSVSKVQPDGSLKMIFTDFKDVKAWFPDGRRVLGLNWHEDLVLADVERDTVTIVVEKPKLDYEVVEDPDVIQLLG